MRTAPESRKISNLVTSVREKSLLPRPDFQRRSVWTRKDKLAFIDTILNGYPFPEIYVASGTVDTKTGAATEVLVDGQQRVQTLYEYFNGVPPFNSSRSITKYKDLTEAQKIEYLSYDVAVRNLGKLDEPTLVEVFSRMNATSYDLNEIERFNAVYLGEYKKFSEEFAQHPFFTDIRLFSPTDIRRMKDLSYVASVTAAMMSTYFNRDDAIEDYLTEYNEDFPRRAEMTSRINSAIEFIESLDLPGGSPAFRKADFYTLIVEIDRQIAKKHAMFDLEVARRELAAFYSAVEVARREPPTDEQVKRYFDATLQNTNDRHQRIIRGQVLQEILERAVSGHRPVPTIIEPEPTQDNSEDASEAAPTGAWPDGTEET